MKATLVVFILSLLLAGTAFAQTDKARPQPGNAPGQTPQLSEADNLSQQVVKLYAQSKYDEAIPLARRALEIRSPALPDADPRVMSALGNLAELYIAIKKFADAEPLYQRILAVQEGAQKPNQAKIAETLDRLALISFGRGNSSATETLYKRALAVRQQAFGPESPQAALALYQLAEFYRYRNQFVKAEPLYRNALEVEDKIKASDESYRGKAMLGLTCLFSETDQSDKLKALTEERSQRNDDVDGWKNAGKEGWTPPVAGGILNGKAVSLPKPSYPQEARARGYGGVVVVRVVIDENGKVIKAADLCGAVKSLAQASIDAALQARFTPTLLSGRPVKVTGTITYKFVR
jgi:TonB family protein